MSVESRRKWIQVGCWSSFEELACTLQAQAFKKNLKNKKPTEEKRYQRVVVRIIQLCLNHENIKVQER